MTPLQRFFAIPFAVRLAWTCWIVLLVAVSVRVMVSKPTSQTVVPIYLNGAERWLVGGNLYAPAPPLDVFLYPPGFAALFSAFTVLPEKMAGVAWRLLSAAVLALAVHRLALRTALSRTQTAYLFSLVAVLAIPSINNGQANAMVAGCVLLGCVWASEGRFWLAATAVVLAAEMKLYPLAAVLLLGVAVPRMVRHTIIVAAIALAIPFALHSPEYGLDLYRQFAATLQGEDRADSPDPSRLPHDWTILARNWFGIVVAATTAKAVSVLAGAIFAAIALTRRTRNDVWLLTFLLASIWMTLFGPCTETQTYTILAPAAAWWLVRQPTVRSAAVVVLLLLPILRGVFPMSSVLPVRSTAALGALLLLVDLLAHLLPSRGVVHRFTQGSERFVNTLNR